MLETNYVSTPLIYSAPLHRAELDLARDLQLLNEGPSPLIDAEPEKVVDWVQTRLGFTLAEKQRDAIRQALVSKVLVVTGGPGVGKTTLVNALIKIYEARKYKVQLAAPTGRAAKRMQETTGHYAQTLHRLLIFDPETGGFKHDRAYPMKGDVFIIDEASMLDLPLANKLIAAIPKEAVLLLVGDVDQLPSVGPGSILRDIMRSETVPVCRLTEIFRQAADSQIITNAHRINKGEFPVSCSPKNPGDFYHIEAESAADVWSKIRGLLGKRLREHFHLDPLRQVQVLTPMQRGELGARNLNEAIQKLLNPAAEGVERFGVRYQVGDRVMQVLNNYEKEVFNGDMGQLVGIDQTDQLCWVDMGGKKVEYGFNELDELSLSYAVTIHKSQGSEYPCVILPLHTQHYMMLQRNLLYTGVTRGKQLVILVGPSKAIRMALQHADSQKRVSLLAERLKDL
jgi:exodeoxyribonuclease V alpha subunit